MVAGPSEVYTWGDNINLTLGHGKEQRRGHPEVVDEFRRNGVSVKEVWKGRVSPLKFRGQNVHIMVV